MNRVGQFDAGTNMRLGLTSSKWQIIFGCIEKVSSLSTSKFELCTSQPPLSTLDQANLAFASTYRSCLQQIGRVLSLLACFKPSRMRNSQQQFNWSWRIGVTVAFYEYHAHFMQNVSLYFVEPL